MEGVGGVYLTGEVFFIPIASNATAYSIGPSRTLDLLLAFMADILRSEAYRAQVLGYCG